MKNKIEIIKGDITKQAVDESSMPQTARFSAAAELTALFTEPQAPSFWPSAARSAAAKQARQR